LFRGAVTIRKSDGGVSAYAADAAFGSGVVEVFWDDDRGVRRSLGTAQSIAKPGPEQRLAIITGVPEQARALAVLFHGVDNAGEPLTATGYLSLSSASALDN